METTDKQALIGILSAAKIPLNDLESCATVDSSGRVVKLHLKSCFSLRALSPEIQKLRHLRELSIFWCRNLETLPKEMADLQSLVILNIGWCDSLKRLPREIIKLVRLEKLLLNGCNQLTAIPQEIWKLPKLSFLCVHNCKNSKVLDLLVGVKEENKSLRRLELSDNGLDHRDLAKLWSLLPKIPNLTNLNLTCNEISTLEVDDLDVFDLSTRLRKFSLTANPIVEMASKGDREALSRILNANRELGFVGLEASNFQASRLHSPSIQHLMDVNESGRFFFCEKSIPLGEWPSIIERAQKIFKNYPLRKADVIFHLLQGPAFASREDMPSCTKRKAKDCKNCTRRQKSFKD